MSLPPPPVQHCYRSHRSALNRRLAVAMLPMLLFQLVGPCVGAIAGPPDGGPPPAVTVTTVAESAVNPSLDYVGRTEAIQAVDLRARVEGFLEQVAFREGADVHVGDLLFVIEQAPYRARLREAQARVTEAAATHEKARWLLQRLHTVRAGGVSAIDLETATSSERQAEARLQEATAALETARLNLEYTTIRAPITGRIGRSAFSRGSLVGPGSGSLARVVQIDPIRVVYAVNEADLLTARADAANRGDNEWISSLRLANNVLYPLTGRFDFMDNQVNPGTGTIAVWAVFDNPQGLLLPGQFVTVINRRVHPPTRPVVPQSAVQTDREGSYVLVVDERDRIELRRIALGTAIGTRWAVESGLAAGETIVVQGVQKVTPGQAVTSSAAPAED